MVTPLWDWELVGGDAMVTKFPSPNHLKCNFRANKIVDPKLSLPWGRGGALNDYMTTLIM